MRHLYPVGAILKWLDPPPEGRLSNGESMFLTVLEQLASDARHPVYLLNEGIVHNERYQVIASEPELLDTGVRR
jgi:hypothetical protein